MLTYVKDKNVVKISVLDFYMMQNLSGVWAIDGTGNYRNSP